MYQLISWPITGDMPSWPGNPQLEIEQNTAIENGDVSNTVRFRFFNHTGTHMDAPNHYVKEGIRIAELGMEYFFYDHPVLLNIPKGECELVTRADLEAHAEEIGKADLLLICSGFYKVRSENRESFEQRGPGIGVDAASYLVEAFPNLRAIALDFVSVGCYSNQEEGNEAHRTLFRGKHYICAIEDVNMEPVLGKKIKKVTALPMMIRGIDSAPITVVAEV